MEPVADRILKQRTELLVFLLHPYSSLSRRWITAGAVGVVCRKVLGGGRLGSKTAQDHVGGS